MIDLACREVNITCWPLRPCVALVRMPAMVPRGLGLVEGSSVEGAGMDGESKGSGLLLVKGRLEDGGLDWGVAAGSAVYIYAGNRLPTDVDLLVRPEDLSKVGSLLGLVPKMERTSWGEEEKIALGEIEIAGGLVIRVGAESYPYGMDGAMVERLRRGTLEGVEVPVLAPEDIIAMKSVLQRGPEQGKHDIEDIEALAAAMEIDAEYLRWRLTQMGAEVRARAILERWGWEG